MIPIRDKQGRRRTRHRAGRHRGPVPPRRRAVGELSADAGDAPYRQCRAAGADEADGVPDQHGARADRRPEGADESACRPAASPERDSTCWSRSRRTPTTRSSNSTMSYSTPHALCWTDQCFAGNGAADVRAVIEIQHGREPRGVVNREVLSCEIWKKRLADFGSPLRAVGVRAIRGAPPRHSRRLHLTESLDRRARGRAEGHGADRRMRGGQLWEEQAL